jgi:AraC-like DNA-binding protein
MENVIIDKRQAMKAGMRKPYVCIMSEDRLQLKAVSFEVVVAKSVSEAKIFFRTRPVACLVAPFIFKGSAIASFLEWFRGNFPKILIVLCGKKLEDDPRLKRDANLILLPSSRPEHAIETVERVLHERAFMLDLKTVWLEMASSSSAWPRKVLKYLLEDNRFLHIPSAQEIANHFSVTAPHLLKKFNSDFPFSLKQFLLLSKLCYAAWLKDTTTLTVEAIALHCGFADGSHLSHVAHKELGMPLSSFLTSHSWCEVLPWIIDIFQQENKSEGEEN